MVVGTRSRRLLDAVEDFGETAGQLLSLVVFLLFGAVLLPIAFAELGWRHFLYAALSLTLIRMVPVALALVGTRLLPVTVAFLGWFGPRGLASILYLLLILESGQAAGMTDVAPAVLITILGSVLLHGASASPAARAYGARIAAMSEARTGPERRRVFPFPTRIAQHRAVERPPR